MANNNPEWMDEIIGQYLDQNPRGVGVARAAVKRYRENAERHLGPLAFKLILAEQIDAAAAAYSRVVDAAGRLAITAEEAGDLLGLSSKGRTLEDLISTSLREGDSAAWLEESFERIAAKRERADRPPVAGPEVVITRDLVPDGSPVYCFTDPSAALGSNAPGTGSEGGHPGAGAPEPGSRYRFAIDGEIEVLHLARRVKVDESFENAVVYRSDQGRVYSRTVDDFARRVASGVFQRIEDL